MIDSELAHKIVHGLRGKEIKPSDVLEALVTYEHKLGLESLQSELTKVKAENEKQKDLLLELSLDTNKVTAMIRHKIGVSQKTVNELYTTQLKVERYLRESNK